MDIFAWLNDQLLRMNWLSELVRLLIEKVFGLDMASRLGGSLHFFIYDVIKIFILLSVLIFAAFVAVWHLATQSGAGGAAAVLQGPGRAVPGGGCTVVEVDDTLLHVHVTDDGYGIDHPRLNGGLGLGQHVPGLQGLGGVHQGRAAAHVDAHAQRLFQLGPGGAQAHQRLDVKADAARAVLGDADRERDKLLVLCRYLPFGERRLGELPEGGHRLRLRLAERGEVAVDGGDERFMVEGTHETACCERRADGALSSRANGARPRSSRRQRGRNFEHLHRTRAATARRVRRP